MKVFIKQNAIKAATHCMAKKDVRFYLNGCLFDFKHGDVNSLFLVSTTGHMLSAFCVPLSYESGEQTGDFQLIIPRDVMIAAAKLKSGVYLESHDDGRYSLGGILFAPIDGVFPDYRRVIPSSLSGEPGHYNPEYIETAFKAMADFGGNCEEIQLTQNGDFCAVVHAGQNCALVAVMPKRVTMANYQGLYL